MPKPYSEDLRQRIVHAVEHQQMTVEEASATFQVSPSFVEKLLHRWRTEHTCAPRARGGGCLSPLRAQEEQLRAWVAQQPDRTLAELQALLQQHKQQSTSLTAISRALVRLGLPRKKSPSSPRNALAPMWSSAAPSFCAK